VVVVVVVVVAVVVVVVEGKFVRHVCLHTKYLRRASCSTRTQTASSWGYVWTAPGCSQYECSREDRSKLRVRLCRNCGCWSELSMHGGRQGHRDQQTAVVIVNITCQFYQNCSLHSWDIVVTISNRMNEQVGQQDGLKTQCLSEHCRVTKSQIPSTLGIM